MFDHYLPAQVPTLRLSLQSVSTLSWLCFSLIFTCCLMLVFKTFRAMVAQSRLVFPGFSCSVGISSLPDKLILDLAYRKYVSFSV